MRRTPTLLLAAVLLSLALAAPALADVGSKLLKDFSDDGALNACNYSEDELTQIKGEIATDTDAYSPDLRSAIDALLEQRAQGSCDTGQASSAGATSTGAGGGGAGAPPAPEAQPTASPLISNDAIAAAARAGDEGDTPPFPLLALAALMALAALGAIVYGAIRFTGWAPAWAPRARHAVAEAGWRASSTWAEFADFVRFGR